MTVRIMLTIERLWWFIFLRVRFCYFFFFFLYFIVVQRICLEALITLFCLYFIVGQRFYLETLLSNDLVPSFDSRILVVGAYEAGKTTLVSNLIGKSIPRERQSTDGIDVYFGKLLFDIKTQKLLKKTKGKSLLKNNSWQP